MKVFELWLTSALAFFVVMSGVVFAQNANEDFRVLAEGNQSEVEKPFVYVARDAETYARLRDLVADLPEPAAIDFTKNAVVAAFAGTKPNGGYAVEIKKHGQTNLVSVSAPPKDSMNIEIITQPFKVVLIPVGENEFLPLEIGADLAKQARNYAARGGFQSAGGIAGKRLSFMTVGTASVWTHGNYTTVFLDLRGLKKHSNRRLMEYASGTMRNGKIAIVRLDANGFFERSSPPFAVSGALAGEKLLLDFKSQNPRRANGFTGSGRVEGKKVESRK